MLRQQAFHRQDRGQLDHAYDEGELGNHQTPHFVQPQQQHIVNGCDGAVALAKKAHNSYDQRPKPQRHGYSSYSRFSSVSAQLRDHLHRHPAIRLHTCPQQRPFNMDCLSTPQRPTPWGQTTHNRRQPCSQHGWCCDQWQLFPAIHLHRLILQLTKEEQSDPLLRNREQALKLDHAYRLRALYRQMEHALKMRRLRAFGDRC